MKKKNLLIAAAGVVVLGAVAWGISAISGSRDVSAVEAVSESSDKAVAASDLKIAVVRMDDIQKSAKILTDLRKQREGLENDLKSDMEKKQKKLEAEKKEIESQQGLLSREALQQKVVAYQKQIQEFQKDIADKANAIDGAFQAALLEIQEKHLDPIINALAEKKKLDLILDARFTRTVSKAENLDITNDIVKALDKKATKYTLKVK